MQRIVLDGETDWGGWRTATRSLVLAGIAPDDVQWSVRSHEGERHTLPEGNGSFAVSRSLVALA